MGCAYLGVYCSLWDGEVRTTDGVTVLTLNSPRNDGGITVLHIQSLVTIKSSLPCLGIPREVWAYIAKNSIDE